MKFEFSAGGIVVKNPSTSSGQDKPLILVAQHSGHHGWVFPKGIIGDTDKKETKEQTAVREVEEETGVKAEIIKPLTPVIYWYVREKEKIKKTVYYFLMHYISGDIADHDWEMEDAGWFEVEEAMKLLSFKRDRELLERAVEIMNKIKYQRSNIKN